MAHPILQELLPVIFLRLPEDLVFSGCLTVLPTSDLEDDEILSWL